MGILMVAAVVRHISDRPPPKLDLYIVQWCTSKRSRLASQVCHPYRIVENFNEPENLKKLAKAPRCCPWTLVLRFLLALTAEVIINRLPLMARPSNSAANKGLS